MSSRIAAPLIRHYIGAVLFASVALTPPAHAATNLVTNGSFESGVWDGTSSFVDSNNSSALMFWNTQVASWIPDSNSSWVQDATKASDGNRFVWLGPPGAPYFTAITYVAQTVAANTLTAGLSYHFGLDYDFFDPTDASGAAPMNSTLRVYYILGNEMDMGGGSIMLMDDLNTQTDLLTESDMTDSWNNPSGLQWTQGGVDFIMPALGAYDYMRIFVAAPPNSGQTPSMGVLVDNISLNLATVPEPGSMLLVSAGLMGLMARRKRSAR